MAPVREPKPDWQSVPLSLRTAFEESMGAPVTAAHIAWGGYSPAASWLVTLADGRQVFVKGAHGGQTAQGRAALAAEARLYQSHPQLSAIAPAFLGAWTSQDAEDLWQLIALEAILPATSPLPWDSEKLRAVFKALHRLGTMELHGLPSASTILDYDRAFDADGWWAFDASGRMDALVAYFENPVELRVWLEAQLPTLKALELKRAALGGPQQPIHLDLRADNILLRSDGAPVLLDWPNLCVGPLIFDLTYFINSVTAEGGPQQEIAVRLAEDVWSDHFDPEDWLIALVDLTGYLVLRASQPDIADMPRLRSLQRLHLQMGLNWLSRLLGCPQSFRLRV